MIGAIKSDTSLSHVQLYQAERIDYAFKISINPL
jgi:hypothetical protein